MFGAGPGQVFGDGLAEGWALAREGSNPSPSAHISPDKAAPLPLFTYFRKGFFSETCMQPGEALTVARTL